MWILVRKNKVDPEDFSICTADREFLAFAEGCSNVWNCEEAVTQCANRLRNCYGKEEFYTVIRIV